MGKLFGTDGIRGIVGENLTAELAYASNRHAADEAQCWYPTAAFSTFEFDGAWADLADGDFTTVQLAAIRRPH